MLLFAAASHVDKKFVHLKNVAIEIERRHAEFRKEAPTRRFDDHGIRVEKKTGVLIETQGENDTTGVIPS
jgi:hypothetical protein